MFVDGSVIANFCSMPYFLLPNKYLMNLLYCYTAHVLQGWLRELVWREEDSPHLRKSMIQALPEFKEVLSKEPVFCFDAAAKLLVWSDLVYTVEDKAGTGEDV